MNNFPGTHILVLAIFLLFIATTVAGALIAALSTRVIRGVCGLALCSIGLAGLYYFLHSPFLALMEILIYIGAVCVTIVFAIMLAEPQESKENEKPLSALLGGTIAFVISGALFWALSHLNSHERWIPLSNRPKIHTAFDVKDIGYSLLTQYSLAFELISLVLLVAIVGALAIARPGRKRT